MNERNEAKTNNLIYLEPLPKGCPPESAKLVEKQTYVFRLVRTNPPTMNDFRSQIAENPKFKFSRVSECRARGLSVFSTITALEKALKLPKFRDWRVCCVTLDVGAGNIQQTGNDHKHYTWWPLEDYEILANCNVA